MAGDADVVLSDRVWTIPNLLSMLRLCGIPVFLYFVLGPESDGLALLVLAFAVLRLITSSYFVGACTGRSAGFSPLRMRST